MIEYDSKKSFATVAQCKKILIEFAIHRDYLLTVVICVAWVHAITLEEFFDQTKTLKTAALM